MAVDLIKSYLSDRSQAVLYNDVFSSFVMIKSGVPQGSVLGPILFSLFINDLPSVLTFCSAHLFADDVQIYFNADVNYNIDVVARKINSDLHSVWLWSQRNLLFINSSKTQAILFSHSKIKINHPMLFLNGDLIVFVDKVVNLGITFMCNLCWEAQINIQCGKIYGTLKKLHLVARHLDIATKIRIFKTLLFPHFIYGDFLYTNASMAALDRLRVALNSCIRFVYNLPRISRVTHLQKTLIGCNFSQFYKFRSCVNLFRIIHTKKPEYLYTKLRPLRSTRTKSFLIPQHSSFYYSQSFFARGVVNWNQLSISIKNSHSYKNFKENLLSELASVN